MICDTSYLVHTRGFLVSWSLSVNPWGTKLPMMTPSNLSRLRIPMICVLQLYKDVIPSLSHCLGESLCRGVHPTTDKDTRCLRF